MLDIRRKEAARDELKLNQFETKKAVNKDVSDRLDEFASLLDSEPQVEAMFTLRWSVA